MKVIFLCCSLLIGCCLAYENSELKCVICKTVVKEINNSVQSESSSQMVHVGGYQAEFNGRVKKKTKSLVQSEGFLSEIMEKVCDKMSDYVRATEKTTGKLVLMNLTEMISDPGWRDVDIIQDSDFDRLEYLCQEIVEEFEYDVLDVFGNGSLNPIEDVCVKSTALCEDEGVTYHEL